MRRLPTLQVLAIFLLFPIGSFGTLHAQEPKVQPKALIDQIWPYQMPYRQPLNKQDQEYAERALVQWLEDYLQDKYKVVDRRFFWDDREKSMWGPISKGHAAYIERQDRAWLGVVTEDVWSDPGFALLRLWKVDINGNHRYFALAMTRTPIPGTRGRRLMARFELKKTAN